MTKLYYILKSHGVTIYAVAKAGGWTWQQVAAWVKGSTVPHLNTFIELQRVMSESFGIQIELSDLETEEGGEK